MSAFEAADAIVDAFLANSAITRFLIESVADEAWRAEPPNGKGRNVAAIAAHMHNVRRMWLKAVGGDIPEDVDRATVTKETALVALDASRDALAEIIRAAAASDGRVKGFKPDVVGFVGYLTAHEAHHRGQIAMLARQVGHPLAQKAMFGMWEWGNFSPRHAATKAVKPAPKTATVNRPAGQDATGSDLPKKSGTPKAKTR